MLKNQRFLIDYGYKWLIGNWSIKTHLLWNTLLNIAMSIFQFSNFNFSCNVKLLQITITAHQLMVSPDQSKGQIHRFHRFYLHLHPHPYRHPANLILPLQIVEVFHSLECHQCSSLSIFGSIKSYWQTTFPKASYDRFFHPANFLLYLTNPLCY